MQREQQFNRGREMQRCMLNAVVRTFATEHANNWLWKEMKGGPFFRTPGWNFKQKASPLFLIFTPGVIFFCF